MRKLLPLLNFFSKLNMEEKKVLMHFLDHEGCQGLYECITNGLTNTTLREDDQRFLHENLVQDKNKFRKLIKECDPEKKKRQLLQVGEGAGLIVEKVVPLLEEYLQSK